MTARKTDIQIVKIDQTHFWVDDIKKKVGKIYTVFLYDKSVVTHCSEITPSYYLIPLYYITEFQPHKYSEEIESEIDEQFGSEEPKYMHCTDVEKLHHADVSRLINFNKRITGRESEFYNNFIEETKEYLTANHVI